MAPLMASLLGPQGRVSVRLLYACMHVSSSAQHIITRQTKSNQAPGFHACLLHSRTAQSLYFGCNAAQSGSPAGTGP